MLKLLDALEDLPDPLANRDSEEMTAFPERPESRELQELESCPTAPEVAYPAPLDPQVIFSLLPIQKNKIQDPQDRTDHPDPVAPMDSPESPAVDQDKAHPDPQDLWGMPEDQDSQEAPASPVNQDSLEDGQRDYQDPLGDPEPLASLVNLAGQEEAAVWALPDHLDPQDLLEIPVPLEETASQELLVMPVILEVTVSLQLSGV